MAGTRIVRQLNAGAAIPQQNCKLLIFRSTDESILFHRSDEAGVVYGAHSRQYTIDNIQCVHAKAQLQLAPLVDISNSRPIRKTNQRELT
jgi:hypothetical protein